MRLKHPFRRPPAMAPATLLYGAVVAQARRAEFYRGNGVPDTVDGRFEMVALHAFLVLRRLKQGGEAASDTAQALFDVMFEDMDRNLREMGAGDLGVGRRVKKMGQAFFGRIAAYDEGLADDAGALAGALTRNLYGTVQPDPADVAGLAEYVRHEANALERYDVAELTAGRVSFGPPPGVGAD